MSQVWILPGAFLLAGIFGMAGFRRRVFRRNVELMRLKGGRGLYRGLCFHAAQDLLSLVSRRGQKPRLEERSKTHLKAMCIGPSLLLTAHFHNWEALGSFLKHEGVPLLGAARRLRTPWAERWLRHLRLRAGVSTVSESVPRAAIRHLASGGCFGLLWDQHAPTAEKTGRFFGVPVQVNPLPFFLLKYHPCSVYFGAMLPGGKVRLVRLMQGASEGRKGFSGNRAGNGVNREDTLIRRYHRVLETLVRQHPEYWYGFFHARFKNVAAYPGHRPASSHSSHSSAFLRVFQG